MWNNGYALEELNEKQIKHYHVVFLLFRILLKHIKLTSSQDLFQINKIIKFIILLLLSSKEGRRINKYDKVHLVPMLNEPEF